MLDFIESVLAFILYFILGIIILGFLGRLLLTHWLAKKQREFEKKFGDGAGFDESGNFAGGRGFYYKSYNFGNNRNAGKSNSEKEGDVKIKSTDSTKKINRNVGDYVDYEEIKD